MFAKTPKPPYLAVIFTNKLTGDDPEGYAVTADEMVRIGSGMDGFLGIESVRDNEGTGITVSYWRDEAAIKAWKAVAEHQVAQAAGRDRWYAGYVTRIAKVERDYSFDA